MLRLLPWPIPHPSMNSPSERLLVQGSEAFRSGVPVSDDQCYEV